MEIESIKIVGIAEPSSSNNARISVIGYLDTDWKFNHLTPSEAVEMFPSQGRVFAPHFQGKCPNLVHKCVFLGVQHSNNNGKDNYIWDWNNGIVEEYGIPILDVRNTISTDIAQSYDELKAKYTKDGAFYIGVDKYVYKIDESINRHYISRWKLNDLIDSDFDNFVTADDRHYFIIKDTISLKPEYVDMMSNKTLCCWITGEVLKKTWLELIGGGSSDNLMLAIREVIIGIKGTPKIIINSRINRVSEIVDDFSFSYEKLKQLVASPIMNQLIERSVEANYQHYINEEGGKFTNAFKQFKIDNEQKIIDAKARTEKKIAEINILAENAQMELGKAKVKLLEEERVLNIHIKDQISTIEKNDAIIKHQAEIFKRLSDNKQEIVRNFGMVKDVFSIFNNSNLEKKCVQNISTHSIRTIDLESEVIKSDDNFILRLSHYLECNNRLPNISKKIFGLLVGYDVLLFSDGKIVASLLNAIGCCKYFMFNVTPEVRSFFDVWNNGFEDIVRLSSEEPTKLHFFVMQNINTSYISCYLQPIVNMITGLEDTFPGTDIKFPGNLRILLISTDEEGLPLAKQCISNFGCLTKTKYTINECNEGHFNRMKPDNNGYLSAIQIMQIRESSPLISSDYESYLIDDEY
ncbi:hypothetical protein prwr041_25380 [Prevotella herbatica]|uniref:Uncharacterized protein n=1 Tax=Prevotella herbatica TaxID=2801997 RepID=A0ABM7P1J3_9BACT|nr:hypothetical protein [Prevotella herbatica]BCS86645.1 hypothetical protein prwr041_25380 [Prevotella herbatica]